MQASAKTTSARPTSAVILEAIRRYSVLLILLGIGLVFTLGSDRFLTPSNLMNIAVQTSIIAIIAIGMTFVILTAGIDLSVGSVVALCGALAAGLAVRQELGTFTGIGLALLAGAAVGVINGLLVVRGKMPPFVATLSTLAIARGLTLVYTEGRPISGIDERFTFLGSGEILGIATPVIILAIVFVIAYIVLRSTRFGNYVYATGGNEEVSRLAGVRTSIITLSVYIISGFLAALGGVLLVARLWSAQPNAAVGLELDAIAAPVLGGVSLFGGVGNVTGALVGAFILGILSNGLNLMGVPSFWQQVIKGVVLILAVMLDVFTKRRR
ncbi:MAG TPA: ribose ABC transporter permease [Chloroflexi bacterium]|jgi:ribose transport system permease protein|nr:ribose ABC transporter permease [Chloroflexota bacterium]